MAAWDPKRPRTLGMDTLHVTLRQLQVFAAIARGGSTMAAAADIALSQSATSAALSALERQLGLLLFDRAGRRLLLNENGRALLPRALALLDAAAGLERQAHGGGADMTALRIGASTTIGNHLLPRLLAQLQQAVPPQLQGWRWHAMIGNTATVCDAVAAFELDVGLIEGPCVHEELRLLPWLDDELVLVAAPTHPLAQRGDAADRLDPACLREAVWLLREPGSGTRDATDQLLLPYLGDWTRSIELGSSEAIKNAAAVGLGVACLSRWVVADALAHGVLQQLPVALPALRRSCHLVLHRDKQPSVALQAMLDLVCSDAARSGLR